MGSRGPAKLPDNVRELRGNPGKRRPPARLKLPPRSPNPPSWLPREAKAEWRRVVPSLDRMGVLATVDRAVVSGYCMAWARFVETSRRMNDEGLLIVEGSAQRKNPLWQVWRESLVQVRDLAKELYLTPSARLRSEIPEGAGGQITEPPTGGILD